jgi:hypothetical protein
VLGKRIRYALRRRMYRGGRPGGLARALNRLSAAQFAAGVLAPRRAATREVVGRRYGKPIAVPIVVTAYDGRRYLVPMLGERANWVRNVRAASGCAVLIRRGREDVRLVEIEVGRRAPILRRFLDLAPGARAHVPVDRGDPLVAFDRIAPDYPVFRIDPVPAAAAN